MAALVVMAAGALLVGCASVKPMPQAGTPVRSAAPVSPSPATVDPEASARLLAAVSAGDHDAVRHAIAAGADIEIRGDHGRTPLLVATRAGDTAIARELILAGADVNATDELQDSAFLYAGAEGLEDILRLTLDHGADVDAKNRYGGTALIPASEHAHLRVVAMLIEAGVEFDHVNRLGWTALQEAIVLGDGGRGAQDVVRQLLTAGADPDIRHADGRTPLCNAERKGFRAIAGQLRTVGAVGC
ncbi:ankyrin repeat domain-containing protein [Leifsonia xyli]|nr:ankyrin repeat domain-containing protein [Leifsonia xyli]